MAQSSSTPGSWRWSASTDDYRQMYVVKPTNRQGAAELSTDRNWLVLDPEGKPEKMIFNQYKTAKDYGQYNLPRTVKGAHIPAPPETGARRVHRGQGHRERQAALRQKKTAS